MATDTVKNVPQTYRTILFDYFKESEEENLEMLLRRHAEQIDKLEPLVADVKNKLEVASFRQFLEKFKPSIYQTTVPSPDGGYEFIYTYKKENEYSVELDITTQSYYQMVEDLYKKRLTSGKALLEFDDAEITKILTPEEEVKAIYKNRRLLNMAAKRCEEKRARHENASDDIKTLNSVANKLKSQYSKPQAILIIGMADAARQLEEAEKTLKRMENQKPGQQTVNPLALGRPDFNEFGKPVFLPVGEDAPSENAPAIPGGQLAIEERVREGLTRRIGSDYDKTAGPLASPKLKEMVVRAMVSTPIATPAELAKIDVAGLKATCEQLRQNKADMLKIFTTSRQNFITTLNNMVCRLLDVKIFFEHATGEESPDARLGKYGLIVANCHPADLVTGDLKVPFGKLMESLGGDTTDRVWFGILPHVSLGGESDAAPQDEEQTDFYVAIDEAEEEAEKKAAPGDPVSLMNTATLLEIMNKARITTVFSFGPSDWATFSQLTAGKLQEVKAELETLEPNPHAICAYPNFTLLPRKQVKLGKELIGDSEKEFCVNVGPIQIDAAYVAAGILAGSQRVDTLIKAGLDKNRFLKENVMVRVDLEDKDVKHRLTPHFARERISNWPAELMAEIGKNGGFGMAFCGNELSDLKTSYLHCARVLELKDGSYRPVNHIMMKDFLNLFLKLKGSMKPAEFTSFLNQIRNDWLQQAKSDSQNPPSKRKLNLVMKETDKVEQDPEIPGKVNTNFGSGEDFVEVEVGDSTDG